MYLSDLSQSIVTIVLPGPKSLPNLIAPAMFTPQLVPKLKPSFSIKSNRTGNDSWSLIENAPSMFAFAKANIDGAFSISDHESLPVLFDLIEKEGLSLGTSCGVNIAGAIRLGKLLGPGKTIVTILCDKSDKYNSKMFNKSFLKEKGLPYPHWI